MKPFSFDVQKALTLAITRDALILVKPRCLDNSTNPKARHLINDGAPIDKHTKSTANKIPRIEKIFHHLVNVSWSFSVWTTYYPSHRTRMTLLGIQTALEYCNKTIIQGNKTKRKDKSGFKLIKKRKIVTQIKYNQT